MSVASARQTRFDPARYERDLGRIIAELRGLERLDERSLVRILRKHPRDGKGFFSRSQLIAGFRHLAPSRGWDDEASFVERLRKRRVRTQSGVAPVTVLTKPFPCPGRCVFCPSDVRMPKSYLSLEPGCQRATEQRFDPYLQARARLRAYRETGHAVDKVELIVLGGTFSHYPEAYRVWFAKRCLDALNEFGADEFGADEPPGEDFLDLDDSVDGAGPGATYNAIVSGHLRARHAGALVAGHETATWGELRAVQRRNETSRCRLVGLSFETRPDCVNEAEVVRLRRLGATKIQLGLQSLSDAVLRANRRGHDVADSRRAVALLRRAGFKVQAHWMPNLLGATPSADLEDFERLFADPAFRPDELKIYPCSLVASAELMADYRAGRWSPYAGPELLDLLCEVVARTPRYCRISRVIRDISSTDIVDGNRTANLREVVEARLAEQGRRPLEIRSREVGPAPADAARAVLAEHVYETSVGREVFHEVCDAGRLLGFLRLSLPAAPPAFLHELRHSALLREVHVYGGVAPLGERDGRRAQHRGLGRQLVERAAARARSEGFADLAVISAAGTRLYYEALGFHRGSLYQHLPLARQAGRERERR